MRPILAAAALLLLPAACAHRPLGVVLSFGVCPVTTPDGRDVDDGGVEVTAHISTDLVPAPRQLAAVHFPGNCSLDTATPGALPELSCSDPHFDVRYVLAWTRPSARTLILERREYATPVTDGVPTPPTTLTVRRPLAEVTIDRAAWINLAPRTTCAVAPQRR